MLREKRKSSISDATKSAAMSGAVSGGVLGGIHELLSGPGGKARLLRAALIGGGLSGGLAGGTTLVGSKLMGAPDEDDATGFTRRAGVGGALIGGAAGAGLGALAQRGKIKVPIEIIQKFLTRQTPKGAAVAGALGLGATGAYLGADQGLQADFLSQESARRRREAMMEAMSQ